ncbi:hypothetical protein BASA81_001396 [Batrachochytrium salamandrivorans]|nr:hypothetical protein BASA81_001396 [Batrachochytrium salamandrivorans]
MAPQTFWLEYPPDKMNLLRMCAAKICVISPSTGVVERGHKISKRTKQRGRLDYTTARDLNFVCAEQRLENHDVGLDDLDGLRRAV